jgi:Holliday junction resolvasome RuvABC ATP-dependent DNA helicase subunit
MNTQILLSPVQEKAVLALLEGIVDRRVLVLYGSPGSGKTTVLRKVHEQCGGAFIAVSGCRGSVEGAFLRAIEVAIHTYEVILVDDLHLVTGAARRGMRRYLLDAALTGLLGEAGVLNRTMVFALKGGAPWSIGRRAWTWAID